MTIEDDETRPSTLYAKSLKDNRQIRLLCPHCNSNLRGHGENQELGTGDDWQIRIGLECVDDACEVKYWWLIARSPVIARQHLSNDFTVLQIKARDDFEEAGYFRG